MRRCCEVSHHRIVVPKANKQCLIRTGGHRNALCQHRVEETGIGTFVSRFCVVEIANRTAITHEGADERANAREMCWKACRTTRIVKERCKRFCSTF
jgi:hypothetical protein